MFDETAVILRLLPGPVVVPPAAIPAVIIVTRIVVARRIVVVARGQRRGRHHVIVRRGTVIAPSAIVAIERLGPLLRRSQSRRCEQKPASCRSYHQLTRHFLSP